MKTSMRIALPVLLATALTSFAHAAPVLRTFVSVSGSDSNVGAGCPVANPCRTIAGAYGTTLPSGEVFVLDAGGYGPLTITGPVTVTGAGPIAISVAGGTTGISINAGAADRVILRNVHVTGQGTGSTTGIALNSGRLALYQSSIRLATTGLTIASSRADIFESDIIGNGTGVSTTGTGVDPGSFPITGPTQARFWSGSVLDNGAGFAMNDPGLITSTTQNKVTILVQSAGFQLTTAIAGNATLVSGSGASCAPAGNCAAFGLLNSQTNTNPN